MGEYIIDGRGNGYAMAVGSDGSITIRKHLVASASTDGAIVVGSTSTKILDVNSDRYSAIIVNDSNEIVYLSYTGSAALNSGIRLNPNGGTVVEDIYTGYIAGICVSAGKVVTVTEL